MITASIITLLVMCTIGALLQSFVGQKWHYLLGMAIGMFISMFLSAIRSVY